MFIEEKALSDKITKFLTSLKTNKTILLLLTIIFIGAFLRLYDFNNLLRFNADQIRDAQIIDTMAAGDNFPFFGPKAGGTKFNLGGGFYYLQYLSGSIFGFSPNGIALFIPILSTISIYLFYLLFKRIFSTNITLGLTFLYAISFYAIKYSHFAWNPNVIPFFLLAFLLLLARISHPKNNLLDFALLGLVIGVASQLHTTLLILMPIATLIILIWTFTTKTERIKFSFSKIFLLIFIFILANLPFIYGNFLDHGKNIQEFFAGSSSKTASGSSLVKNITADITFFLQGSAYYLTGIEPQKNWGNIIKLIKSKNLTEIVLFISSLLLFLAGGYSLFIEKIKSNRNKIARNSSLILLTFSILAFLFFIFIGNELNIRFFIILSFLPYLLLGALLESIYKKINSPNLKAIIFSALAILLILFNLNIFSKTYNLDNYTAPESAYGGISLGELNEMCSKIDSALKSNPGSIQTAFVDSFEFKRSLGYICLKKSIVIKELPKEQSQDITLFFAIVENANAKKNIEKYSSNFKLEDSQKIKRFTLLTFSAIK
ncbi:MAG: glycosyltransferase family 39 protein [Candidatus Moraniibacteriota bacterium]